MELVIDALGESATDAVDRGQVGHSRLPDALQSAELPQKCPAPLRAQPGNRLQTRGNAGPGTALPVARNGEPVGLVPDLLDQQECRRVRRQGAYR
jgi:hypothetical protein